VQIERQLPQSAPGCGDYESRLAASASDPPPELGPVASIAAAAVEPTSKLRRAIVLDSSTVSVIGFSNAAADAGFAGIVHSPATLGPERGKEQCLGAMPWNCRATAIKPDAPFCWKPD
jgi:hypothetical protein